MPSPSVRPPPSAEPSRIVLPAHKVAPFDPRQAYEERIGGRQVVYLDNNAWIYLRDAKTPEACEYPWADARPVQRILAKHESIWGAQG
jgi:hypothetical protein